MPPNISHREYIRWLPHGEPGEPTSTIVLTSNENRFVDIRVFNNPANLAGIQPFASLDWAFAGTSYSKLERRSDLSQVTHAKWKHWIDSRYFDADSVKDEAVMVPLGTGRSLERGQMVDPYSNSTAERDYEESWREVPMLSQREDGKPEVLVLVLDDSAGDGLKGMVVRVGQFIQGFARCVKEENKDVMALERWAWSQEGGWKREVRMGDVWTPCGVVAEMEWSTFKIGAEIVQGDWRWKVVEKSPA